MLIVTTENVANHRVVRTLGIGIVVRSRGLGGNIVAGLRSIVGGEIPEYTRLLEDARRHAIDRLVENATAMGANAIVMMRFDSAEQASGPKRDLGHALPRQLAALCKRPAKSGQQPYAK